MPVKPAVRYLRRLEAESIHIIREVAAQFDNSVLLYSIGKDSSVLLHLAKKAFYPAGLPFPLLHVDTGWKFREMIEFRDALAADRQIRLLIHQNEDGLRRGVGPLTHGSEAHTEIMKTEALKQALDKYKFNAAIGGARRDEEAVRAKERIFSFRNELHRWNPKAQRPEVWNIYNGRINKDESVRVFPLSNWTEFDIWSYIADQGIAVVPLYFAKEREVLNRDGLLIARDDERLTLKPGERFESRMVRFRTLGCYPLTGAMESTADSVPTILAELGASSRSERAGRAIDHDRPGSMEQKKREGYF